MQAAVVHRLATGGANGKRLGLANLRGRGGGREGWGGARSGAGKAGAGGGGGAVGPGSACSRACAGPPGCASRSRTPSGASPPQPGAVKVRASPGAGIVTRPPGERRRRLRGLGQEGGRGAGAGRGREGGRGGERRHLERRPASLREVWRCRWGSWRRRASVDPRRRLEEEVGGRCRRGDRSR